MKRWFSLVALLGAAACTDPVSPTAPSSRAASRSAAADARPVLVELKFQESRRVRHVAGALREQNGRRLQAAERALERHGGRGLRGLFEPSGDRVAALARAATRRGRSIPDLQSWYRVEVADQGAAAALIADLRAQAEVESAYEAPAPQAPPGFFSATPSFAATQAYFGASVEGTGAEVVRTQPGGDGRGVQVVDLEYAWYYPHEDLGMSAATHHLVGTPYSFFGNDHGTAVLGILGAIDNGFGVTGGVPGATIRTASPFVGAYYSPAAAIVAITARLQRGDILLLEQQTSGPQGGGAYVPLEWIPSVYDAIRAATSAGVIVVEAAGNGAVDLDGPALNGRFNPALYHSGAIIVGAGDERQATLWFSSYGSRLDVQAWGANVVTTGYGELFGTTEATCYTRYFSGTSSASAIVAATVASLQGYIKASAGEVLDAAEMTVLLRETGRPQAEWTLTRRIGPFPDLLAALQVLAPLPVTLDILPGSTANSIALRSRAGLLPVAVLTTADFDAATLDLASMTLGDGRDEDTPIARDANDRLMVGLEDVDEDGDLDAVLHFERGQLIDNGDLTPSTTALELNGRRADGRRVHGSDVVTVVP